MEARVECVSSDPQLRAASTGYCASSRTFVGSKYMFVDVTTSKQYLVWGNIKHLGMGKKSTFWEMEAILVG